MQNAARSFGRVMAMAVFALASICYAAEKPRIQVNDYIIQSIVTPQTHRSKPRPGLSSPLWKTSTSRHSSCITRCVQRA